MIEAALDRGETAVEVPILWSISPYLPFDLELRSSPSNWKNHFFARYYGLEEVTGILTDMAEAAVREVGGN